MKLAAFWYKNTMRNGNASLSLYIVCQLLWVVPAILDIPCRGLTRITTTSIMFHAPCFRTAHMISQHSPVLLVQQQQNGCAYLLRCVPFRKHCRLQCSLSLLMHQWRQCHLLHLFQFKLHQPQITVHQLPRVSESQFPPVNLNPVGPSSPTMPSPIEPPRGSRNLTDGGNEATTSEQNCLPTPQSSSAPVKMPSNSTTPASVAEPTHSPVVPVAEPNSDPTTAPTPTP